MTNNFEHDEHDAQDEFIEGEHGLSGEAPRSGMAGNLVEAWRSRPFFKFMVLVVAVFAVGVAGVSFFGGNDPINGTAHLTRPPNLHEAAGGAASPYMREQTEMANKERSEQAIATGGSALPTPIGQAADVTNLGKDDALNELRAETESLKKQVQQQQVQQQQQAQQPVQQPQAQPARPPEPFDNTMSQAMQRQMERLLESWEPKGIKNVAMTKPETSATSSSAGAGSGAAAAAHPGAVSDNTDGVARKSPAVLVNAGTVSYAQLITEANSDVPGPILAQIVSGPLAGARVVGAFQVSDGYEKYLVMKFTLADKKGKDYSIDAVALDPDTTLGGMATEVDERYFVRVVLPAAAGFLQGMGQAIGQGNSSVTTNGSTSISSSASNGFKQGIYNGLGQSAQTMSQFFQNQANVTKPLVRVAAGTPMGLFFVTSVMESDAAGGYGQQNCLYDPNTGMLPPGCVSAASGTQGYGRNPSYPYPGGMPAAGVMPGGYGYPGTTVPGYGGMGAQNGVGQQQVPYPNYATPGMGYATPGAGYGNRNSPLGSIPTTQAFGQ